MLEERLRPIIWGLTRPEPATERQLAFLASLSAPLAKDPLLTKVLASAWIDHYLSYEP